MLTNGEALAFVGAAAIAGGSLAFASFCYSREKILLERLRRSYQFAEAQMDAQEEEIKHLRGVISGASQVLQSKLDLKVPVAVVAAGLSDVWIDAHSPLPVDLSMRPAFTQGDRETCGGCGKPLFPEEIAACPGETCKNFKNPLAPFPT